MSLVVQITSLERIYHVSTASIYNSLSVTTNPGLEKFANFRHVTLALCVTKEVAIGFIQQVILCAGVEEDLFF
jgi:hypothetical protein